VRPDGPNDFVLEDESSSPLDQDRENIQRPRADRNPNKLSPLIPPKQAAIAPIEAKFVE
jgi:hypothetical protein